MFEAIEKRRGGGVDAGQDLVQRSRSDGRPLFGMSLSHVTPCGLGSIRL
jgi:hypothetical protein